MDSGDVLRINWEWESGRLARAPEHTATWARIEMFVGLDCLTLVEDSESSSSRRSIFAPLYPLAEWIVYNWWFLLNYSRPARPDSGRFRGHCMRAAGDGFLWPNVVITPEGRETRISWNRDHGFDAFAPIRYLGEGEVVLSADGVERTLTNFVTSVLDRLVEQGVTGTPLEKEWGALASLGTEEREYCIAAARLGLDPFAEADPFEEAIIDAARRLPKEILGDFFDAVEPSLIRHAVDWITGAAELAGPLIGEPSGKIRLIRDALAGSPALDVNVPWRLGFQQARIARRSLGIANNDRVDIEDFVPLEFLSGVDRRVQAVGVAPNDSGHLAVVSGRTLRPGGQRFIQGRALWRGIARDESTFLITTSYTDLQKVERAFSAEFLAPIEGIRGELGIPPSETIQDAEIQEDDLLPVAEHFEVSSFVIKHQIENLGGGK